MKTNIQHTFRKFLCRIFQDYIAPISFFFINTLIGIFLVGWGIISVDHPVLVDSRPNVHLLVVVMNRQSLSLILSVL